MGKFLNKCFSSFERASLKIVKKSQNNITSTYRHHKCVSDFSSNRVHTTIAEIVLFIG